MSTLLTQNSISGYEAITALIAGGLIMIPITRLRRTLPGISPFTGAQRYCHLWSDHDVWSFVQNTGSGLDSLFLLIFLRLFAWHMLAQTRVPV